MDPEYSAREESPERRGLLPMFVAASDEDEQRSGVEADSYRAADSAPVERDWVTARMMDSYN